MGNFIFYEFFMFHFKTTPPRSIESDQIKITLDTLRNENIATSCDDKKSLQTSRKIWFFMQINLLIQKRVEEKLDEINFGS